MTLNPFVSTPLAQLLLIIIYYWQVLS